MQAVAAALHDFGHWCRSRRRSMPPAILPRSRWSFCRAFPGGFAGGVCWCLSAGGRLPGLLSFHGIFSRKKRRKIPALFGLAFSGAADSLRHVERGAGGPACIRSGAVQLSGGRGPPAGSGSRCRSGGAVRLPGPAEKPPSFPAKISSDFSGEVFYARGLSLDSWYINAPL